MEVKERQCSVKVGRCKICGAKFYYDTLWWAYKVQKRTCGGGLAYDYLCSWHCTKAAQELRRASLKKRGRKPKRPQWDMEFREEDAGGNRL